MVEEFELEKTPASGFGEFGRNVGVGWTGYARTRVGYVETDIAGRIWFLRFALRLGPVVGVVVEAGFFVPPAVSAGRMYFIALFNREGRRQLKDSDLCQ